MIPKRAVLAAVLLAAGHSVVAGEAPPIRLVWHVETVAGEVLESREADVPVNPASVVKVATTLLALERLGPEHRFETRFVARGTLDAETGVLDGDLLVEGGGDPDFHVENGWLVARELNAAGLRVVRGRLVVDDRFWIGWEGEARSADAARRRSEMAKRLTTALDPARWDRRTERSIEKFRLRAGIEPASPSVTIEGAEIAGTEPPLRRPLVVHRSNPLRRLLKRFNAYSNNDIERLGDALGSPSELARQLRERWGDGSADVSLASLSGLGRNRMTPRQMVRLLRDLVAVGAGLGLTAAEILPGAGCDAGTLEKFPHLSGLAGGTLLAKTGTLVSTDGGVAVLAGVARTAAGDRYFSVVAPAAGRYLIDARAAQGRWVLDLLERHGGADPGECGAAVGHSTDDVELLSPGPPGPPGSDPD